MTKKDGYKLLFAGGTGLLTAMGAMAIHRYITGYLLRRGLDPVSTTAVGSFCVIIFLAGYLWGAIACYLAYRVRDLKE